MADDLNAILDEIRRAEQLLVDCQAVRDQARVTWERATIRSVDGKCDCATLSGLAGVYYYWRDESEKLSAAIQHNLIAYAQRRGLLPSRPVPSVATGEVAGEG